MVCEVEDLRAGRGARHGCTENDGDCCQQKGHSRRHVFSIGTTMSGVLWARGQYVVWRHVQTYPRKFLVSFRFTSIDDFRAPVGPGLLHSSETLRLAPDRWIFWLPWSPLLVKPDRVWTCLHHATRQADSDSCRGTVELTHLRACPCRREKLRDVRTTHGREKFRRTGAQAE